jgi:signal transduction histidine kinase
MGKTSGGGRRVARGVRGQRPPGADRGSSVPGTLADALPAAAQSIALGTILGGFLHETKNSLMSIHLIVANLVDELSREPEFRRRQYYLDQLHRVHNEFEQLAGSAFRLEHFQSHGILPVRSLKGLNDLVGEALQLFPSALNHRRLRVEQRFDAELGGDAAKGMAHAVDVDANQVRQVVFHVLLNAIEASPARGRIFIATRYDGGAELRVGDQGNGISPSDLPRVFEPFFSTKGRSGLGLYISRFLIEQNSGSIGIESHPGKGTTVVVRFAVASDAARR